METTIFGALGGCQLIIYPDNHAKCGAPAVSVIIPTYNRYRLLGEAVGSVLCQTFTDFELIVVDDGSDDATMEIPARGLLVDEAPMIRDANRCEIDIEHKPVPVAPKFFRLVRIAHTGMPGAARNNGVKNARGRFIAFLDSDDVWLPGKLDRQIRIMNREKGPRISHTREAWLRSDVVVSQKGQKHRREGDIFTDSLVKCVVGPSTVMLERSFFDEFGGFRVDLEIGEDYEIWIRMLLREPVAYLDMPLTIKRAGHGDQLTEKYGHIEYFRIRALIDLVENGAFTGSRLRLARLELSRKCDIYAKGAEKRGRGEESQRYHSLAAKYAYPEE